MRKETKDAAEAVTNTINELLCQVTRKKIMQVFEELEAAFADHSIRDNVMKCSRCKLRVTGMFPTDAGCPNGCGPLRQVTWKEECQTAEAEVEKLMTGEKER